jgi:NADH dehydrogenase (ubiquinone) Fe-S protein 2
MAASITRLAGSHAKRLCLRHTTLPKTSTPRVASTRSPVLVRSFSAVSSRRYATEEPYMGTKLVPTDEHFAHPTNPANPQQINDTPDSNIVDEDVEKRKIRHYTVNFGPQHPAAHGVLRLILVRMDTAGRCYIYTRDIHKKRC